ncbi:MAG TPA: cytochrome c [Steroidobacteraceae bacterium]|jgi:mono/diheme cytochrome c family protein|nr:cytochrome c [Steroidobacteraceae bacterium]
MKPTTQFVLSAIAAAGVALIVAGFQTEQTPPALSSGAATSVGRGEYLAEAANCMSCHTRPGAAAFSGGVAFTTRLGIIYSSNITPDRVSGIGAWTLDDLRRAMHEGIAPGGRRLFPAFPYTSFTEVSDADVAAIYAYLRTLQPVRYSPPPNSLLLRQRWGMVFWDALFLHSQRFQPDARRPAEWNRGAYLVEALGHCDACHTPRNVFMAEETGKAYAGGPLNEAVPGGRIRAWSAVNLTSAHNGLAAWSVSDLARYLKTGFSLRAGTFGPMNEVIDNSLKDLSEADVHAMSVYLKSLPPLEPAGMRVPESDVQAGARIYSDHCQECHMRSGRGGLFSAPPLAASAVVQAQDPSSLINVILYGPDEPKDLSFGGWQTMQPYKDVLSDAQIAAVSNFVRGSWKNRAGAVTSAQVARQR